MLIREHAGLASFLHNVINNLNFCYVREGAHKVELFPMKRTMEILDKLHSKNFSTNLICLEFLRYLVCRAIMGKECNFCVPVFAPK